MLKLRDLFQYDNIIKKMIKQEYEENKVFRFPEEYKVRNEDEQRKIVFKNSLEKGRFVEKNTKVILVDGENSGEEVLGDGCG